MGAPSGRSKQRESQQKMTDTVLMPTPNDCALPRIRADFATFNDAVDYAAKSAKGLNFHDRRG
jgi:fatty-acyl-CoA synthase